MKRPVYLLLAQFALVGTLTGCTVTTSTSTNSAAPATNAPKPAAPATNTAAPAAPAPTAPAGDDQLSNLTIYNKTTWAVHHLYMSPTKQNEWGPDQLGQQTIEPGSSFTLNKIPCNTYDIKVVDEDGDECVIEGEKFCGHEATWNLTDDELLNCEGYGDK